MFVQCNDNFNYVIYVTKKEKDTTVINVIKYKDYGQHQNPRDLKFPTYQHPLKPGRPRQLVVRGIGGAVSGGRAVVPGNVIDCGAGT